MRRMFPVLLLVLCASPAYAGPITFTLSGVVFDDGATASGFVTVPESSDLGNYAFDHTGVEWEIETTGDLAFTYTEANSLARLFLTAFSFVVDERALIFHFAEGLYASRPIVPFDLVPGFGEHAPPEARTLTAGSLIVTGDLAGLPVPDPSTALLLAVGLMALHQKNRGRRRGRGAIGAAPPS